VSRYDKIVSTPQVAAEAWNMTGNDGRRDAVALSIKERLRSILVSMVEIHHRARQLIEEPAFECLGLADVSLLSAARATGADLLTADGRLHDIASRVHVRSWLLASA
jgi:predicted nucleic acid-binding protein